MFGKFIYEKLYCGLDIGSHSIKASLIKVQGSNPLEIIGVCENKTYGFKDAFVTDLAEFSECINNTINDLVKKTGVKVKGIQLGINGQLIEICKTSAVIPLIDKGSKVIGARHIKIVNEHARLLGVKMDDEILHEILQCYQVDDVNLSSNPLGLYGSKLGVHALMIIVNNSPIRNVIKAVNQAGYDIDNIFYSSYVASKIVLSQREKMDGCVLIDIGTKVTTVFIFQQKTLKYFGRISLGGG